MAIEDRVPAGHAREWVGARGAKVAAIQAWAYDTCRWPPRHARAAAMQKRERALGYREPARRHRLAGHQGLPFMVEARP